MVADWVARTGGDFGGRAVASVPGAALGAASAEGSAVTGGAGGRAGRRPDRCPRAAVTLSAAKGACAEAWPLRCAQGDAAIERPALTALTD